MLIQQYGITYQRVAEVHLEMLRRWRNHPSIAQYMIRKDYISEEQQKKWFKSVNNNNNYFFIIYPDDNPIGLVHCKDINYNLKMAEIGIFIFDDKYVKTKHFLYASMTILNFAFYNLKLDKLYINVLKNNTSFIKTIEKLNFSKDEVESNNSYNRYFLKQKQYEALFEKHGIITKLLLTETNTTLEIIVS